MAQKKNKKHSQKPKLETEYLKPKKEIKNGIVWFCDALSVWSLRAIVFAVPLIFSPWLYIYYELPKLLILRTFTALLIALWIVRVAATGKLALRKTPLNTPILAYLGITTLATIFSINPSLSIFGGFQRYEGLITIINYALIFLLATNTIRSEEDIHRIFDAALSSAIIVSSIGILQRFNLNLLELATQAIQTGSTMGNSAFLGMYLVLIIPLALTLSFARKKPRQKILPVLASLTSFICLIFTYARGSWVAIFFMAIAAGIILVIQKKPVINKKVAIGFASIFILILIGTALLAPLRAEVIVIKDRLLSLADFKSGTIATRLILWESTLKIIASKPILGYGPETLMIIYPKYLPDKIYMLEQRVFYDRAHNQTLEIAATTGILGLIAYLWIIGTLLWWGIKILNHLSKDQSRNPVCRQARQNYFIFLGLMIGLVGYILNTQFNPTSINFAPLFWIFLSLAMVFPNPDLNKPIIVTPSWLKKNIALGYIIATFALLIILTGTYFLAVTPLQADFYFKQGFDYENLKTPDSAIKYYHLATKYYPYSDFYFARLGEANHLKMNESPNEIKEDYFNKALAAFSEAAKLNPENINLHIYYGTLYGDYAQTNDPTYYQKAIRSFEKAIEINPSMSESYTGLSLIYLKMNRLNDCISYTNKAIKLSPDNFKAYLIQGWAYTNKNLKKEAVGALEKALEINPNDQRIVDALNKARALP